MSGFDLGSVFVTVKAITTDFTSGLNEAKTKLSGFQNGMAATGASFARVGAVIGTVAATAGAAIAGLTLKGGFDRALNIQDAEAHLDGLGYGLQQIKQISGNVLDAVKGTAYSLDQGMKIATNAIAAGIQPGIALTKYIKGIGDAATIAGTSLDDMGYIFNKIQATGKITGETLQMLQDRGIPVLQWLAQSYGVTAEAMADMVSRGQVDATRFQQVMEEHVGGAALKSGNTVRGAFENMKAAMARAGAAIVTQFMPQIQQALGAITQWFDAHSKEIADGVGAIAKYFKDNADTIRLVIVAFLIPAFIGLAGAIYSAMAPLLPFIAVGAAIAAVFIGLKQMGIDPLKAAFDFLKPSIDLLWANIQANLIPALENLWHNFLEPLMPLIGALLVAAIWVLINALTLAVGVISWVANQLGNFGKFVQDTAYRVTSFFLDLPGNISRAVAGVYDAITKPFRDAFNWIVSNVQKTMNTVKSWLDPFQRHSPSLVDRVTKGVAEIRDQYSGMFDALADMSRGGAVSAFAPALVPAAAVSGGYAASAALAAPGATSAGLAVTVDLRDSNIVGTVPRDVAEQIGDSVVKRLQQSVRV